MKNALFALVILLSITWFSCDTLNEISKNLPTQSGGLTDGEIVSGLKEALQVGTNNASGALNKVDGYFKDPLVKILFPPDAQRAADKLRDLGMGKLVDDFVMTLNRAAEEAAKEAGPIFVGAIKEMTFADARNILTGPNNAATNFFRDHTRQNLYDKFIPVINTKLSAVNATKHWTDITTTYNKIPFVTKVETDLPKYATNKALDGLFLKLEGEEKKIRENPAARISDLLKKVFGSLDK
jgi:Protein of unknown function (DUF4197)